MAVQARPDRGAPSGPAPLLRLARQQLAQPVRCIADPDREIPVTVTIEGETMIAPRPDERRNRAPAPQPQNKPPWRFAVAAVLALVGIIGIFAIGFPTQFKHQLEISVFRQPTPYTQLFFSDPRVLPKKLEVGHVNKFSFTVANDQGHSATYRYTVTISGGKLQKVAGGGSFTIGDGQSITRTVEVVPASRKTQYLIKIALNGTVDFIQFYGDTP